MALCGATMKGFDSLQVPTEMVATEIMVATGITVATETMVPTEMVATETVAITIRKLAVVTSRV